MALPSPNIGIYDFGQAQRGIAMQQDATQYLVQNMTNLGKGIAESISLNNARKEAEELGPIIQSQYMNAFKEIENGNVAQGLSGVYGTSMQISANPLLKRIAQDANQAASYASTAAYRRTMEGIELENRLAYEDARQKNRMELKEAGGGMTNSAAQSAERYMLGLVNKLNDPDASIADQKNSAAALQQAIDRMAAAGQEIGAFEINPGLNSLINEGLKPMVDTLNETLNLAKDENLPADKKAELLRGARELEGEIKKIRGFEIKVNQPQPSMDGMPMPDLSNVGNEDIIPIVPDPTSNQQQRRSLGEIFK